MRCPGKYYNGPEKRFVRCYVCGDVDYEANETDRCKNEDLKTLERSSSARCSCDDMGESPCSQHGWGSISCDLCGADIEAPLTALSFMLIICQHCHSIYVGEEDFAHGYWRCIHAGSTQNETSQDHSNRTEVDPN